MAEVVERVAKLEEQYDAIMQRFDRVDGDVARVEGRLDAGLADVKQSITRVEGRLDVGFSEVRTEISDLRAEMSTQFRWVMGGIGGAVLAAVAATLGQMLSR
jgi:hypothetical protein